MRAQVSSGTAAKRDASARFPKASREIGAALPVRTPDARFDRAADGTGDRASSATPMRFELSRVPVHAEARAPLSLQAKLTVGAPGDRYEQEADRVAEQVTSGWPVGALASSPARVVQRKCDRCESEDETIRGTASGPSLAPSPQVAAHIDATRGGGAPLPPATRSLFEPRFGHDFRDVRVHDDAGAQATAAQLRAEAFTIGRDIYFAPGRFTPETNAGRHLLAHELTHVVQQSRRAGGDRLVQRQSPGGSELALDGEADGDSVQRIEISTASNAIVFHARGGTYEYALEHQGLVAGTYQMSVTVGGNRVHLTPAAGSPAMRGTWAWRIRRGQPNPATLLRGQRTVEVQITDQPLAVTQPQARAPAEAPPNDPNAVDLTPEEALRRCQANDLRVMTFPMRLTRFGAAPIIAGREGDRIRVHQPVYVLANRDFRAQTRTLPSEVFAGGVALAPNQIVRVRIFTPRWYHLNLTGDATGDEQQEMCVTGEQMLAMSHTGDVAVMTNIGLTVLDALPFAPGVGTAINQTLGRAASVVTSRVLRPVAAAAMIGLGEAVPAAGARVAQTVATAAVETQAVERAAQIAIAPVLQRSILAAAGQRTASTVADAAGTTVIGAGARTAGVSTLATVTSLEVGARALGGAVQQRLGGSLARDPLEIAGGAARRRRPPGSSGAQEPAAEVLAERPHVRQTGTHSCGAACGEMGAGHHGARVTEADLMRQPGYVAPHPLDPSDPLSSVNARMFGFEGPPLAQALESTAPIEGRRWVYQAIDELIPVAQRRGLTDLEITRRAVVAGLDRGGGVFIARINGGQHWIVIDRVIGGIVHVRDPALQTATTMTMEQLSQRWTWYGIFCQPR